MKIKMLMLLFLCSMVFSCVTDSEDSHHTFAFNNVSAKWVYVHASLDYPDTVNNYMYNLIYNSHASKVAPYSMKRVLFSTSPYESLLKVHKNGKRDTLMIYVLDVEKLKAKMESGNIEEYDHDVILQRMDVDIVYLQKNNWMITFLSNKKP